MGHDATTTTTATATAPAAATTTRICEQQVVYLDVDVVVKGDLAELYNVTMSTALGRDVSCSLQP